MKQQSRHARRMRELAQGRVQDTDEGKWTIRFVLGGKEYKRSHQLSQSEVKHMKDLCVEFGDVAAAQVVWKMAVKGVGMVSERLILEAAYDFVKNNYVGPIRTGTIGISTPAPNYETLAQLEAYSESVKPLEESKAFDIELGEEIRTQEQIEGKL